MGRSRRAPKPRARTPGQISHNEKNRDNEASRQRSRLLDMSDLVVFRVEAQDILSNSAVAVERQGAFLATLSSRASRQGIREAIQFIREKKAEGFLDADTEGRLVKLLERNAVRR